MIMMAFLSICLSLAFFEAMVVLSMTLLLSVGVVVYFGLGGGWRTAAPAFFGIFSSESQGKSR
jgi:hypothetical protein